MGCGREAEVALAAPGPHRHSWVGSVPLLALGTRLCSGASTHGTEMGVGSNGRHGTLSSCLQSSLLAQPGTVAPVRTMELHCWVGTMGIQCGFPLCICGGGHTIVYPMGACPPVSAPVCALPVGVCVCARALVCVVSSTGGR